MDIVKVHKALYLANPSVFGRPFKVQQAIHIPRYAIPVCNDRSPYILDWTAGGYASLP